MGTVRRTFSALVFGTCIVWGVSAYAADPAWYGARNGTVDLSAFRYRTAVSATDDVVPRVVEIPLRGMVVHDPRAVVQASDGTLSEVFVRVRKEYTNVPIRVVDGCTYEEAVGNLSTCVHANVAMTDRALNTATDFSFHDGTRNTAVITFLSEDGTPFTTSALYLTLAPNVALPRTVAIKGFTEQGPFTVVAEHPLEGTDIRFPVTHALGLTVTFGLAQPLRLAEVDLVQADTGFTVEYAARILAQPGVEYLLYVDPDRSYGTVVGTGVDLVGDTGVREVADAELVANPLYVPADTDTDGMPDVHDNCVSIANPDQRDVDGNGQGDACDDFDRDGIMAMHDNCSNLPNTTQIDTDGDGMGDACDTRENRLTERSPWVPWAGMGIAVVVLLGLFILVVRSSPVTKTDREDVSADDATRT